MNVKPIIPSPYNFDLSEIMSSLEAICKSGKANAIHFDVLDKDFSDKNYDGLADLIKLKDLLLSYNMCADVHLVALEPLSYLNKIISLNLSLPIRVSAHIESQSNLKEFALKAKMNGISPGLAIKLQTPLPSNLNDYADFDYFHLICNNESAGLAQFQIEIYEKIKKIRTLIQNNSVPITLDCGVKEEHIIEGKMSGANNFVMGSAIFKNEDPEKEFERLSEISKFEM